MMDQTVKYGGFMVIKSTKIYFGEQEKRLWILDELSLIGWPDPFPKTMKTGKFTEAKVSFSEL